MIALALVLSVLALGISIAAYWTAYDALKATKAKPEESAREPSREDKLTQLRAVIAAARVTESALGTCDELPARMMLAVRWAEAECAKAEIRILGSEP